MKHLVMWILSAQLIALFCLVSTDDEIPIAGDFDMYQREIKPSFPISQREVQLPLLIQGEPMLSPRGRKPLLTPGSNVKDFPPGRPSHGNIENICSKNRHRVSYDRHNLPQTGFSHLGRQGKSLNELEEGFTRCCLQSNKLRCAQEEWKTAMDDFCTAEFSVKTRHYHCCKKRGSEREDCFSNEAPNPSYDTPISMLQEAKVVPNLGATQTLNPCPRGSPMCRDSMKRGYTWSDLAFPPGKPKSSNIQNICKLGKYRLYTDKMLAQNGHKYSTRQSKAINRMEKEFKKCCKTNDVSCAQTGWENVLDKFCEEERGVKTVPHTCCNGQHDQALMSHCFSSEAPFPEYDREVEKLNLGLVTENILEKLCGEFKLLTKKHLSLLTSGLKDSCCALPQDSKLRCAAEQKDEYIKTLCGSKKDSWKDPQDCCNKGEQERGECFSFYLQDVSVAVMERK
ncbi:extracellular matrix protein 1 isoform X2 [Mixophyes fleayi]|uniref:extracellular matrix protein 1 isoform X2 n=1 Tax=Mixophyes fleayi TaxID=3061075 RepID=UPI003F4DB341